jgi:plastocyanin
MNNKAITLLVALVLVIGGVLLFMNKGEAPVVPDAAGIVEENSGVNDGPAGTPESEVKEFTVTGSNFAFAPKSMAVKVGDKVRITFVNSVGMHDLRLDDFAVATKVLKAGESETVEFIATKAGSFEYYCSVGTHRQMGMVGTLTVN